MRSQKLPILTPRPTRVKKTPRKVRMKTRGPPATPGHRVLRTSARACTGTWFIRAPVWEQNPPKFPRKSHAALVPARAGARSGPGRRPAQGCRRRARAARAGPRPPRLGQDPGGRRLRRAARARARSRGSRGREALASSRGGPPKGAPRPARPPRPLRPPPRAGRQSCRLPN